MNDKPTALRAHCFRERGAYLDSVDDNARGSVSAKLTAAQAAI